MSQNLESVLERELNTKLKKKKNHMYNIKHMLMRFAGEKSLSIVTVLIRNEDIFINFIIFNLETKPVYGTCRK